MADKQDSRVCLVCLEDLQENSCPRCNQNSLCRTDLEEYEAPAGALDESNAPVADPDESVACVAEQLERTGFQTDQVENVECDFCTGRKEKAIKTCLVCLASYCETHLRLHNDLNVGKAHLLVEVTGQLQRKMCPQHHKLLEVYCRTDHQCICYLCMLDTNHKGHDIVSAAAERAEKQ
ncbi:hypothetical protein M9458_045579, partial [Cirrhinus mrigala]